VPLRFREEYVDHRLAVAPRAPCRSSRHGHDTDRAAERGQLTLSALRAQIAWADDDKVIISDEYRHDAGYTIEYNPQDCLQAVAARRRTVRIRDHWLTAGSSRGVLIQPDVQVSASAFALAQFAKSMDHRDRDGLERFTGRGHPWTYHDLGLQLEDRTLLVLGGRCRYFPVDIVERWLASDAASLAPGLEELPEGIRSKLPPLATPDDLAWRGADDDSSELPTAFSAALELQRFYVPEDLENVIFPLLFGDEQKWGRFLADLRRQAESLSGPSVDIGEQLEAVFDWITACARVTEWMGPELGPSAEPWGFAGGDPRPPAEAGSDDGTPLDVRGLPGSVGPRTSSP
jgi:hypothetical protein